MRELQGDQRAHWLGHDDAQSDGDWKFEVPVQGEQDHEDQHYRQGPNERQLRFGGQQLAVFSAPFQTIALRQLYRLVDGLLAVSLQRAPDRVLQWSIAPRYSANCFRGR